MNKTQTEDPKMSFYSVDWSYPTSPNASKFGCNSTGCWVVNKREKQHDIPVAVAGAFAKKEDAEAHADIFRDAEAKAQPTVFDKARQIRIPLGPVGQSLCNGRWYIRMGWAGFNNRANNGEGYATKARAEAAIRKLDPMMREIG